MIIKKYATIAVLLFAITGMAMAQHHRGILAHSEDLSLTTEQEEAIWEIQYDNRKAKKSKKAMVKKSGKVDLKTKAVQFQSAIDTILTEEQRLKWREIQAFNSDHRKVRKEEMKEELQAYREIRQSYIEEEIKPVIKKHRMQFEDSLSDLEKSSIAAARLERAAPKKSGPPSKGSHDRLKENRKSVAKIIFDHKDELDQIWSDLDSELAIWNEELKGMKTDLSKEDTKNREHHTKNRNGNRRTAGFSQLDFILIDY